MKLLIILSLCLVQLPAWSAGNEQSRKTGQEAHIIQLDEDFPIEELEAEGAATHSLAALPSNSEALPPAIQDRFFRESGLDSLVADWSGFDRDRLALRCEHQDPEEVSGRYEHKLPKVALSKLKALIKAYRNGKGQK